MKIRIQSLAVCSLAIACLSVCAFQIEAQSTTASLHGTVTDPTGAIVANATVTVINTSTGISNTESSDSKGYYVFPDLHIGGPYTVTVGEQGFQKFIATGIMLDLSSSLDVDAKLQIGGSSQTIQVNSTAVQVETSDVQLKSVIGAAELEELQSLVVGSKPLPLSVMVTSNPLSRHSMATTACVAPECFKIFVNASWTARNKWCRDWDETGWTGACAGSFSTHWMPVRLKYSCAYCPM